MSINRRDLLILSCIAGLLALSGCKNEATPELAVAAIGNSDDPFESGLRLSAAGQLARAAYGEGLVSFDEQGQVIPALADRWIVTDDGLTYIFRLRDGLWSDGSVIFGDAARDSLRQAIDGLTGTALGEGLGAVSDVRAMTGRVVEVRLAHPMPDLLELLAQPELALMHKGRWSGPLAPKRDGRSLLLRPVSPEKRGLVADENWADKVRVLRFTSLGAGTAISQFRDGKVSAVLGGTAADYANALGAAGLGRTALHLDQVSGLFGLAAASSSGPLATPELREALAMAIDREALASDLGIPEWTVTTRVVPATATEAPPTINERWIGKDMARRRAEAAARLARLRGKGGALPSVRIALPSGLGADSIFERLKSDFAAVGVRAERVSWSGPADLRLVDSVARYARADWYLDQFACHAGRNPCSDMADMKAAEARAASDPTKRASLLEDAETALTLSNTYLPLGAPVRWSLVRGDLPGFAANPRGWHPLAPIARPRP
jgi:peptide/nickel transport system substrate-binding protein/oligopeptide transport system substrate-binding protein